MFGLLSCIGVNIGTIGCLGVEDRQRDRIAFYDSTRELLELYQWDGTDFSKINSGMSIPGSTKPAMCALNDTDIVLFDVADDDLNIYRWATSKWYQKYQDDNTVSESGWPTITALSKNEIAFLGGGNNYIRFLRFDGESWSQVGNALNITSILIPSITALSGTSIALVKSVTHRLYKYSFDGTDWSLVGNSLDLVDIGSSAVAALDDSTVAYVDDTNKLLSTYEFDGTDWALVGNALSMGASMSSPCLTAVNETDVIYYDSDNELLKYYEWDGSDWSQVGNSLSIPSVGNPAIAFLK